MAAPSAMCEEVHGERMWSLRGVLQCRVMLAEGLVLHHIGRGGRHLSEQALPPFCRALYRYMTERVTMPSSLLPACSQPNHEIGVPQCS